jgi:hypothetical protein
LSLRGGVIVNDIFLAGVGLSSLNQYNGSHELEYVGATMSSVTAEVMVFPVPYLPMSCTAGVGWGSALAIGRLEDDSQGRPRYGANGTNGVSWMGAVGWDLSTSPGATFGLQARYDGAALGELGVAHGASLQLWANFY